MSTERNTVFYLRVICLILLHKGLELFSSDCTWSNERMTRELVFYMFRVIALYTQVHSQLKPQFVLLLLYVLTANRSHLHGVTKCRRLLERTIQVVKYK